LKVSSILILFFLIASNSFAVDSGPHYLRNASFVLTTGLAGIYASDHYMYLGQSDKKLHARYGYYFSAGTTVVSLIGAYVISDSKISSKWKERIVGCAGPLVATAAGIGKEIKDKMDPTHHTSDVNDAYATAVGGAFPLGCVLSFSF
jgi:hypothetical protein